MQYVAAAAVILIANAVPAFAPPTWSILVWFELAFRLNVVALIIIGVAAAVTGRGVLAMYMRHSTRWMPRTYVENMHSAGDYLMRSRGRMAATFALFFVSPLSSAQLFAAAGIMRSVQLRPLLAAFALGRSVTYTMYVTGAHLARKSSLGDILVTAFRSPWGIALQIVMVLLIVLPGLKHWNHHAGTM